MFVNYNPNPLGRRVDDCSVRAVSKALNIDWDEAFDLLTKMGKIIGDLQNSNAAIDLVLRTNGFYRYIIPNTCPYCYTAEDFCKENSIGTYVLGFGHHVAAVIDGDLYDASDTSRMMPLYYYRKEY